MPLCCRGRAVSVERGDPSRPPGKHRLKPSSGALALPSQPPSLLPATHQKDLSLKIIVTSAQQTIQRGHYAPRERPRCWCHRETQQRSVLSRLGLLTCSTPDPHTPKHILTPGHTQTCPGTRQAHAAAPRGLGRCPAAIPQPTPVPLTAAYTRPALDPHCQPRGTGIFAWGALMGCWGHKTATSWGPGGRPALPCPAWPGSQGTETSSRLGRARRA